MADIGRNINGAFDRGYTEFAAGAPSRANPYQARHMRNAWRAGWDKAQAESQETSAFETASFHS